MDHREIEGYLPDFAADDLDKAPRAAVAAHVDQCEECQSWLETHDFLFAAISGRKEDQHPSSEILALCITRPEEDYEFDGTDLDHHLAHCEDCRRDLERVSDAVRAARPSPSPAVHTSRFSFTSSWWRVAAAGILGVGIGSLFDSWHAGCRSTGYRVVRDLRHSYRGHSAHRGGRVSHIFTGQNQ